MSEREPDKVESSKTGKVSLVDKGYPEAEVFGPFSDVLEPGKEKLFENIEKILELKSRKRTKGKICYPTLWWVSYF